MGTGVGSETTNNMQLHNPTENEVSIIIKGTSYSIPAMGDSQVLSAEVLEHWKATHGFLQEIGSPAVVIAAVVPVEAVEAPVEVPLAEVKEEVAEIAPKTIFGKLKK